MNPSVSWGGCWLLNLNYTEADTCSARTCLSNHVELTLTNDLEIR